MRRLNIANLFDELIYPSLRSPLKVSLRAEHHYWMGKIDSDLIKPEYKTGL